MWCVWKEWFVLTEIHARELTSWSHCGKIRDKHLVIWVHPVDSRKMGFNQLHKIHLTDKLIDCFLRPIEFP